MVGRENTVANCVGRGRPVAFVGHFSPVSEVLKPANSIAGSQVQRQIVDELGEHCGRCQTACYVMVSEAFWPVGPLVSRSSNEAAIEFIGYINLPVVKHCVFAFRVFIRLLKTRPRLCLQYNSFFFENFALLLYRFFFRYASLVIIIQDIHVASGASLLSKKGFRALSQSASLFLSRFFDMILPVTAAIIADFSFDPKKCLVFNGGITEFATQLMGNDGQEMEDVGVFAGALEPHNGIGLLVDQWLASGIEYPLHVFGRGSLEAHVKMAARKSSLIVFHGLEPEQVVLEWQRKARWNFCLRYSVGLDQRYFFPSKLFNVSCAPGSVIVNDFYALPSALREYLSLVADDLSDLGQVLSSASARFDVEDVNARREVLREKHSWRSCVAEIVSRLGQESKK
jgi:hypothetical protein